MIQPGNETLLRPIELVVLQGTSFCNLDCTYCDLSAASRRQRRVMGMDLVTRIFFELFASEHLADEVTVVWHSGEPLTLPPAYYDEAIAIIDDLRHRLAPAQSIRYEIQTNGVLIDEKWVDLFRRHDGRLGVGISCDGPASMHDAYRKNWSGRPTHARTVAAMDLLAEAGIPYKVIAVVTDEVLRDPATFYSFFNARRENISGFHFNILASGTHDLLELRFTADDRSRYYRFYRDLLALVCSSGEDALPIANFTQTVQRIIATEQSDVPATIHETSAPLKSLTIDAAGNVTTFYAGLSTETLAQEYGDGVGTCLGNIRETSLDNLVASPKLALVAADFRRSVEHCVATCPYASVCSGGYEITKRLVHGDFAGPETAECVVQLMALTDAVLDDLEARLITESQNSQEGRIAATALETAD